jgi:hypothetical protein
MSTKTALIIECRMKSGRATPCGVSFSAPTSADTQALEHLWATIVHCVEAVAKTREAPGERQP